MITYINDAAVTFAKKAILAVFDGAKTVHLDDETMLGEGAGEIAGPYGVLRFAQMGEDYAVEIAFSDAIKLDAGVNRVCAGKFAVREDAEVARALAFAIVAGPEENRQQALGFGQEIIDAEA